MKDSKTALRKEMKARREALVAAHPDAGERLAEAFAASGAPGPGRGVAGYWPFGAEIDPRPLLRRFHAQGHDLSLPALIDGPEGLRMIFRAYEPDADLSEGPYGIWQPGPEAAEVFPDLILAPLLAFDRKGGRLGYGGGFYDRALDYLKATKKRNEKPLQVWGVAFSAQEVPDVPTEPHDQRLDAVLTEAGWIATGKTI